MAPRETRAEARLAGCGRKAVRPDRRGRTWLQLDRAVDEYALQAALELQLLNPNDPHVV